MTFSQHCGFGLIFDASSGQKVKRITSANPVNVCTARQIGLQFDEFETSYCARSPPGLGGSAQDWNIRCHNGLSSLLDSGRCADNQICVDGVIDAETGHRQAECVGMELFVQLAQSLNSRRAVRITPGNPQQTSNMMEVALTKTWDSTIAYNAAHIQLEAQDVNGETIVPLKGFTSVIQCDNCPSIGLQPWPANTASFLATVTVNVLADEVTLYAANIVP